MKNKDPWMDITIEDNCITKLFKSNYDSEVEWNKNNPPSPTKIMFTEAVKDMNDKVSKITAADKIWLSCSEDVYSIYFNDKCFYSSDGYSKNDINKEIIIKIFVQNLQDFSNTINKSLKYLS